MRNIVIGIVAHVDAGKTTLTEAMLYRSGAIDRLGRVDKRDAHLDTHSLERERGITIFSKLARMELSDTAVTIVDTPGHVDFSTECERALSVEDYAILVISAADGVTAHTKTLAALLAARRIPTFIFVNKCDIAERRRADLLAELRLSLGTGLVDFTEGDSREDFLESCAATDVRLMNEYFESETLKDSSISDAILRRTLIPCYFGSALKLRGVDELLLGIRKYTVEPSYPEDIFGARIYKIDRDTTGRRIAFAKITGGTLRPKAEIEYRDRKGEIRCEKVEELCLYSADKRSPLKLARAGMICGILGTKDTEAGMGLGFEQNDTSLIEPVLNYSLRLPEGIDAYEAFMRIAPLGEEDPSLQLTLDAESREIKLSLMGEIQREVLTHIIEKRFGLKVGFDEGKILYRETIADTVIGSGHFEPLMHYAEVHLRVEPLPEGSGIIASTECPTDTLALNWQRLVMTHIKERTHRGILLGAPLTDVKITLVAGKAHQKHTSGGDFRQATYRAIRQAIRKAGTVVLEPTFDFTLEVPEECLGRAITDLAGMRATHGAPEFSEGVATLSGNAPVETIRSYHITLRAYTRGEGKLTLSPSGYKPHTDPAQLIEAVAYDPERDERHTASSVFCKGGSGYTVPWDEADELMHIDIRHLTKEDTEEGEDYIPERARSVRYTGTAAEDKELDRIFEATYGKPKRKSYSEKKENTAEPKSEPKRKKPRPRGDEYVILDGYNVIFALDSLRPSEKIDFSLSRELLIRMMCSYASFKRCRVIIVFDAYRVKDGRGSVEKFGDVTVIYTKEKETADAYIERATYEIAPTNYVRVVTSDLEEQYIILGNGALRVSCKEFEGELRQTSLEMDEIIEKYKTKSK